MVIEGDRIILRSWQEDDVDAIIDGLNNIEVSKWLATVPYPYDKEEAKKFLSFCKEADKGTTDIMLAIVLKETNEVIGGVSIQRINRRNGTAGGGIWLNAKYQKNGYGTEAFSLRAKFCFDVLGLRRLENGYIAGNEKSAKMQEKVGYKYEGLKRKHILCMATGEIVDECITGLLKEEFIDK